MKVFILFAALLSGSILTGCASTLPASKVQIPVALLQKCPQLYKLEGTTGEDLLRNITANAALYHSCSDSKTALIEAVQTK